jgi:hypothetical protein
VTGGWTPPFTANYRTATAATILSESSILNLLNRKTEQAKQEMVMDWERSLFGSKERNPLRQAIADAYDEVVNKQEEIEVSETNAAWDAVNKRKEKKAEARVEKVADYLDDTAWDDGDTVTWKTTFHANTAKEYCYVAVRGGPHWYITGDNTKYTSDGLTAKIVGQSCDGRVVIEDVGEL